MRNINKKTYRIALDAMGGDFAPNNEILGAIEAFKSKSYDLNLHIIFIGNEPKIRNILSHTDYGN